MVKLCIRLIVLMVIAFLGFNAAPAAAQESTPEAAVCSPARPPDEPGISEHTLESGGLERRYLMYVPESYDPARQTALVFSLHGYTSNPEQQMLISAWNPVADDHGFVVVYPQGTGAPTRWNAGEFGERRPDTPVDDVAFIRDLIGHLSEALCVDPARVYASGLSNGGGMSNRLACDLADMIAAIGPVAGAYSPIPGGCNPSRPVPVLAFHGTDDRIVPYEGLPGGRLLPDIQAWAGEWAARNGCDPEPEAMPAAGDASGIHYINCDQDADVILYTIDGGGHTWPGGGLPENSALGHTSQDINASETLWAFFAQHPLPAGE